jgi:hypothetical protein
MTMHIVQKLVSAAVRPENWDMPGLLTDAASTIETQEAFIRSLLDPEQLGCAVPGRVRDDAREALGRERVES